MFFIDWFYFIEVDIEVENGEVFFLVVDFVVWFEVLSEVY